VKHLIPLSILLVCSLATAQHKTVVNEVHPFVNHIIIAAQLDDASSVSFAWEEHLNQHSQQPQVLEETLFQLTRELRDQRLNATFEELLGNLKNYRSTVTRIHPESKGNYAVAVYPIAAAAHGVEQIWNRRSSKELAFQALQNGDYSQLNAKYIADLSQTQHDGLKDAVGSLSAAQIAPLHKQLLKLSSSTKGAHIAWAAAQVVSDYELSRNIILNAPSNIAIRAILEIPKMHSDLQTQQLWTEISIGSSATLAAPALSALASRYGHQAKTRLHVLGFLGDEQLGSSAALSLSKISEIEVLQDLENILNDPAKPPRLRKNAALSLKLNNNPQSNLILSRFANQDEASQLQQEVQQWLR